MSRSQLQQREQRRQFGLFVHSLRDAERLTQFELGSRCVPALTVTRLSKLERGMVRPRPQEIEALTAAGRARRGARRSGCARSVRTA